MPTVPTYQRQVQQQNISGEFRQPDVNPTQPFAQANGQVVEQAFQLGMKQKKIADDTRIKEAVNQLDAYERSLYDPETGVFAKQGKEALELQDQVDNEYNQLTDKIYQDLGNDDQRRAFEEIKQRRKSQIMGSVAKYELRQFSQYADQQDQTAIELSMELASDNYENPQRVDEEIEKGLMVLATQNERVGGSKEDLTLKAAKYVSRVHLSVLDRMAREAPTAAIAYYEKNEGELFGDDEARAKEIIDTKAKVYEADNIANEITAGSEQKLSVWRKKAREIKDPSLRKTVLQNLESRWADVELIQQERTEEAWDQVEAGTNPETLDSWVDLDPATRQQMQSRYRQIRQGVEPVTDDMTWLETQDMTVQQLASMKKNELYSYRDKLDDSKWNTLVNQWSTARAAARQPEKRQEIDAIQSDKERLKLSAVNAGLIQADQKLTDLNEQQSRRYLQFQSRAEQHMEAEQFARGRKLTPTEKQEVLDEMTRQTVFIDNEWFGEGTEVPVASLVQGDIDTGVYVPVADIPAGPQANMRSLIERNGWTGGDVEERMERAYAYLLMNNEQAAYEILKGDN
jgi:hypothetical protein